MWSCVSWLAVVLLSGSFAPILRAEDPAKISPDASKAAPPATGEHITIPLSGTGDVTAETQWRPTLDPTPVYRPINWVPWWNEAGKEVPPAPKEHEFPLAQVYLTTRSKSHTIEFTKVFLDGRELTNFRERGLVYWQFYPTATLEPKAGGVELQLCFFEKPRRAQTLELELKTGERIAATLPPFAEPEVELTGIRYSSDFKKMYVTYEGAATRQMASDTQWTSAKVTVNGDDLTKSTRVMELPCKNWPGMLAVSLLSPAVQGQPFHVRLELKNGKMAQAILRASKGIFLTAFGVDEKDEKLRKELGLDLQPFSRDIGADPACEDELKYGNSLVAMLPRRLEWYNAKDERLCHAYACVVSRPETLFRVYAQALDGLQINPYCLQYYYGKPDPKFPEQEENFMRWARLTTRPRGWYYIAETFCRQNPKKPLTWNKRMLERAELRLMVWGEAIGQGCRGISFFDYGTPGKASYDDTVIGFSNSPSLLSEIKKLNSEIKSLEPILSAAMPISAETVGDPEKGIRVYVLWSGAEGVLVIARNLDYMPGDRQPNELGNKPRFKSVPKDAVQLFLRRPAWLTPTSIVDPLDPKTNSIPYKPESDHTITVMLDKLDLVKLIWIPHANRT